MGYIEGVSHDGCDAVLKEGEPQPHFIGPYLIFKRVSNVAYELEFPPFFGFILSIFHVLMLRKYVGDSSLVVPLGRVGFSKSLSYEELLFEILDQ